MKLFYGLIHVTQQPQQCLTSPSQMEALFRAIGRTLEGSELHTLRVSKQSGTILGKNDSPFIKQPVACYRARLEAGNLTMSQEVTMRPEVRSMNCALSNPINGDIGQHPRHHSSSDGA